MIKLIATLAMFFFALVFVGVAVLKNRRSHWIYATARVVSVALAAVLSVLASNLISSIVADVLYANLEKNPGVSSNLTTLLEKVPSLGDTVSAIIGCVLAPFVFLLLFLVLKGMLYIVCKPVSRKLITLYDDAMDRKLQEQNKKLAEEYAAQQQAAEAAKAAEATEENPEEASANEELVVSAGGQNTPSAPVMKQRTRKYGKNIIKTDSASPLGMLCGAVCGLLVFVALLAPFVGLFTLVSQATAFLNLGDDEPNKGMQIVTDVVDAAANNSGSQMVRVLGGTPIFNGLTTYRVGDHRVNLMRETKFMASAGTAIAMTANEESNPVETAKAFRKAGEAFTKTDLLPVVLPEICHAASESWDRGEAFCGIAKPSFGETMDVFMNPMLDILADSTYDTVKVDVKTIMDLMATVVEKEAMDRMKENPILLFEDKEFTSAMLLSLLENPRMSRMIGGFLDYGVDMLGGSFGMYGNVAEIHKEFLIDMKDVTVEKLGGQPVEDGAALLTEGYAKVFADYGLKLDPSAAGAVANKVLAFCYDGASVRLDLIAGALTETDVLLSDGTAVRLDEAGFGAATVLVTLDQLNFSTERVTDAKREADALAVMLADLSVMMNGMKGSDFAMASSVRTLAPILDHLAATETIGKVETSRLLIGLLQAKEVRKATGLSVIEITEIAETIIQNAEAKGYATLMVSLANTIDTLMAVNDPNVDLNTKVETLMENMTPESATVLQQLARPSLMISNGVPEAQAEASASMMSNMFGNLAAYGETMSEEDYRREANAVTHVTNLAMSAGSGESDSTFGEGSTTGASATEYVNQVLDSVVVSTTVRQTVYTEGSDTPATDPLNTGMTLNEAEEAEVLTALNERWAAEADQSNEEVRQNYIAIGAMVNLPLSVTDAGIVVASN